MLNDICIYHIIYYIFLGLLDSMCVWVVGVVVLPLRNGGITTSTNPEFLNKTLFVFLFF